MGKFAKMGCEGEIQVKIEVRKTWLFFSFFNLAILL